MKVSGLLPPDDVEFLDRYAADHGIGSRSAALQRAVRLLRGADLGSAYDAAWTDWDRSDDSALWATSDADGLARVRRGEVRAVQLAPTRGARANTRRPSVVSNDAANTTAERLGRGVITVVPVTSNVEHVYPFQVPLPAAATGLPRV